MIALSLVIASLSVGGDASQCTMNPMPLAVEAVKASKDVKSFVVASPKSMSILLNDGTLIRVVSMGCVDSASVAHIWVNNPPPAEDEAAWRKLLIRIASVAFDPADSKSFAAWLSETKFTHTDRFALSAGISEDVDLSVDVEPLIDGMSAEVTMSVTYH